MLAGDSGQTVDVAGGAKKGREKGHERKENDGEKPVHQPDGHAHKKSELPKEQSFRGRTLHRLPLDDTRGVDYAAAHLLRSAHQSAVEDFLPDHQECSDGQRCGEEEVG